MSMGPRCAGCAAKAASAPDASTSTAGGHRSP